jgi:hypothetical protein
MVADRDFHDYDRTMCLRLFVVAGFLPGCFSETHRPACSEPVYTELADDESSPTGMTARTLLARATPGWAGIGDHNGTEVDIAFTVERGDGPALFADTEEIDVVTRSFDLGGGDAYLLIDVTCEDWLEVPADFAIRSEEAGIDFAMDAVIRSPSDFTRESDSGADIEGSVPYDESGLVVDGIDDTMDEQTIEVSVSILPAQHSQGSFYWHGSESDHDALVRILAWGEDSN